MEKKLVVLEVPSIDMIYEVYVPLTLTVRELAELLAKSVEELSSRFYVSSGNETLCLKETNQLLDADRVVSKYDIQNGDHIVMI